jgi:hypothetical protein
MKTTGLVKSAAAMLALAIVSACGSLPPSSSNALGVTYVGRTLFINGRPVTAERVGLAAPYALSLPDPKKASKKDFEFVFNQYDTYASVFDYPKSTEMVTQINGLGGQGCTNALYGYGKGIFWNVGGQDQIEEFKVVNTYVRTLSVNYSFPSSCAMDTSGDLAVGMLYGTSSGKGGGDVVIFKNATGTPTVYTTALDEEFFDGYDNKGNLFADGFTGDRSGFALVELPYGSTKFIKLKTSNSPSFPGSVQWDGTYVTVFDQHTEETYRYTVSGTTATLESTIKYSGSRDCAQTWLVKGLMYCGDAGNDGAEVFDYPAGGKAVATLTGSFDTPLGVTAATK